MFRPISMIVPDSGLIAEIILFGEGFSQTRVSKQDNLVTFYLCSCLIQLLAKKVFTLYSLAVQQLSKQDHYDFGLRALVSVLKYAGRKKRLQPDMPDEEVFIIFKCLLSCVYACVHMDAHTCSHAHKYAHTHACTNTCTTHTNAHTRTHTHTRMLTHTHTRLLTHTHTQQHTHTHTHTTHTHIHTHTQHTCYIYMNMCTSVGFIAIDLVAGYEGHESC